MIAGTFWVSVLIHYHCRYAYQCNCRVVITTVMMAVTCSAVVGIHIAVIPLVVLLTTYWLLVGNKGIESLRNPCMKLSLVPY